MNAGSPSSAGDRESRLDTAQLQEVFTRITADPRYQSNLDWGKPRSGHPEGTVRAHIDELEANLRQLASRLTPLETVALGLLIHVHDTFKPDAASGVPIAHPRSHASLARTFLAEYLPPDDPLACDLLTMIQFHDEPYALWNQTRSKSTYNRERMTHLLTAIDRRDLFDAFVLIDGCTDGKSTDPLLWWFLETHPDPPTSPDQPSRFGIADIAILKHHSP